jgi:hypothetical protein
VSSPKLSPSRRFVRPSATDTWEAIAAREFPGEPVTAAVERMRAWNAHLANRRGGMLLVSDVVFLEP